MDLAHLRLAVRSVVVSARSALAKTSGVERTAVRHRAYGLLAELERSAPSPAARGVIADGRAQLSRMDETERSRRNATRAGPFGTGRSSRR